MTIAPNTDQEIITLRTQLAQQAALLASKDVLIDQLKEALAIQKQAGGFLGEVIARRGWRRKGIWRRRFESASRVWEDLSQKLPASILS